MKIKVELDKFHCKGCGACAEVAPDVFEMDETGDKANLLKDETTEQETVELSAAMCPTKCIEVTTEKKEK